MRKIKLQDEVVVISGKYRGKVGKVKRVLPAKNRVIVEGVNIVKKHVKQNPQQGIEGGIIEKEAAIHVSNVAIYNSKAGKGDRVKFKVDGDKKYRVFASSGEAIDII